MGFVLALYCWIPKKHTKTFTPFSLLMNLQSWQTSGLCSTWHYLGQLEGGTRIIRRLIHTLLVPRLGRHKHLGAAYVIWSLCANKAAFKAARFHTCWLRVANMHFLEEKDKQKPYCFFFFLNFYLNFSRLTYDVILAPGIQYGDSTLHTSAGGSSGQVHSLVPRRLFHPPPHPPACW